MTPELLIVWMLASVGKLMGPIQFTVESPIPADAITTEAGQPLTTESGSILVEES